MKALHIIIRLPVFALFCVAVLLVVPVLAALTVGVER